MSITGAEAILKSLKSNGIDHLFANPGSDFAPIIESYAETDNSAEIPACIVAPHENICVSMAHGYYLATGRMQAAMVHVNVGLANAVMGLINAHADDIPIMMLGGRTPLTEHDREGGRRTPIQYGQEMFDQTAMVRETVKWDYELRYAENAADLVSRAASIARSEPVGAVYMSLPREPLCERTDENRAKPVQVAASRPFADPSAVTQAAGIIAEAENPLIVCSRGDAAGVVGAHLAAIAEENSIAVSEVFCTRNVMASDHPNLISGNLAEHLPEADVVVIIDAPVAWIEAKARPAEGAIVIHIGPDPLFSRMPVRGYRTDLAIQANTGTALKALRDALPGKQNPARREQITKKHENFRTQTAKNAEQGSAGTASKAWVAKCISDVVGDDGIIFNERGGALSTFRVDGPNRWFGNTQAGGLGWCLPAALGFQYAHRDRLTVALIGDGSYIFANPVACHQVAEAYQLPLLTVVLNNEGYDAVRTSTLEIYPAGSAAKMNRMPMVPFGKIPDYGSIAAAGRAWTEHVTWAEDFPAVLARAVKVIRNEKRQALIDVLVAEG